MKNKLITSLTIAGIILGVAATNPSLTEAGYGRHERHDRSHRSQPTILELVTNDDGEFDVLQAAVIASDLVDLLNSWKRFTVFAPTDAAFIKTLGVADESSAIQTINDLPTQDVQNIVGYHITRGRKNSNRVLKTDQFRMLNGQHLTQEELVEAGISQTDIRASNGIVHVIDSVLLP